MLLGPYLLFSPSCRVRQSFCLVLVVYYLIVTAGLVLARHFFHLAAHQTLTLPVFGVNRVGFAPSLAALHPWLELLRRFIRWASFPW